MANFFLYRVAEVYVPIFGADGPAARYVPEFSGDGGTSWRPVNWFSYYALIEAQQALANIISNENTFREAVVAGTLGTLTKFYAYP